MTAFMDHKFLKDCTYGRPSILRQTLEAGVDKFVGAVQGIGVVDVTTARSLSESVVLQRFELRHIIQVG